MSKPMKFWGITYRNGVAVIPNTIRGTRKDAIREMCRDHDGLGSQWSYWKSKGCKAIKVIVTIVEQQP